MPRSCSYSSGRLTLTLLFHKYHLGNTKYFDINKLSFITFYPHIKLFSPQKVMDTRPFIPASQSLLISLFVMRFPMNYMHTSSVMKLSRMLFFFCCSSSIITRWLPLLFFFVEFITRRLWSGDEKKIRVSFASSLAPVPLLIVSLKDCESLHPRQSKWQLLFCFTRLRKHVLPEVAPAPPLLTSSLVSPSLHPRNISNQEQISEVYNFDRFY